jgi:hypothetical protein
VGHRLEYLSAIWTAQRSYDSGNFKIFLPLEPISRVIPFARTAEPEETGQPIWTNISQQHFQSVTFELLLPLPTRPT